MIRQALRTSQRKFTLTLLAGEGVGRVQLKLEQSLSPGVVEGNGCPQEESPEDGGQLHYVCPMPGASYDPCKWRSLLLADILSSNMMSSYLCSNTYPVSTGHPQVHLCPV